LGKLSNLDSGFNSNFKLEVTDWKKKVSEKDKRFYEELQKEISRLSKAAKNLSASELRLAAQAIDKARREQKKIIYKYDFKRFVDEIFAEDEDGGLQDKVPTPDFHIEMYNAYEQASRVCVVCPRGHGKSSCARIYILHQMLNKLKKYIIIIGSSEDMAGQNMRWIRDQFTDNKKLRDVYGDLQNKKKWAETEFLTMDNIKVSAKGAGQKIRGANEKGRPDLIYIDDLEDDEMVKSKDTRKKIADWFLKAVLPVKSKKGVFIVTGTILDNDSLLKNIALNKYRDNIPWRVLWYQALYEDENGKKRALWEDMHPVEELIALKANDPETFAQEYQNNPTSGTMRVFQKEWYQRFDTKFIEILETGIRVFGKIVNVIITTDLAISEAEGADYTVVMATGMSEDGMLYVLEFMRWRTSDVYEILDEIFKMADRWHSDFVSIETVQYQKAMVRIMEKEMDRRKQYLYIEELKRKGSTKLARIKSLTAPLRLHRVFWSESQAEDIEEELNAVTANRLGKHDDILDCLADAWDLQTEHRDDEVDEDKPKINTIEWMIAEGLLPTATEEEEELYSFR
jgi:predicted phage terminase large subunit-like protein